MWSNGIYHVIDRSDTSGTTVKHNASQVRFIYHSKVNPRQMTNRKSKGTQTRLLKHKIGLASTPFDLGSEYIVVNCHYSETLPHSVVYVHLAVI